METSAQTADGRFVVGVGPEHRELIVWELSSGREVLRKRLFESSKSGMMVPMRLTPDDRLALVGAGSDVVAVELLSGKIVRTFTGHRGNVTTLDVSPNGRWLASGSMDATVLTWDLWAPDPSRPLAEQTPTAEELPVLWAALAGEDAEVAWRAALRMALAGKEAAAFLGKHLAPVEAKADPRVPKLIADLDSNDFQTRERASAELAKLDRAVVADLKAAMLGEMTPEAKNRIKKLLAQLDRPLPVQPAGSKVQCLRGIAVLERIGDDAARKLRQELAAGASSEVLTDHAAAALQRLSDRQ